MASSDRGTTDRLKYIEALRLRPYNFDFHTVMRRFEAAYQHLPRWGKAVRPSDEPIRLGQLPETAFPVSMLSSFIPPGENSPGRLFVRFFGLFGPKGPLPLHLTEYFGERLRHNGDPGPSDFVNLFQHRLLVLFHRAWAAARPTAEQDRPGANNFDRYLGALVGIGMPSLLGRDIIPDRLKLQYAGRLSAPSRNVEGLRELISDFLSLPVDIEEFVGDWIELPEDSRWQLGVSPEVSSLGRTTIIGCRVWRRDHKFRVVIGPLSRASFRQLLPGSFGLNQLSGMVRAYVGDELDWDVRLILGEDASQQLQLGRGHRLGWYTRLGRTTRATHQEEVIVHPVSHYTERSTRQTS